MRLRYVVITAVLLVAAGVRTGWAESTPTAANDRGVRLVVLVVVDQLTTEHLDRYRPLLVGGLGRLLDQGAWYRNARFVFANTETGPGHATIATGAWPDVHGIVGNRWVDRSTGAMVPCVSDLKWGSSPHRLRTTGIADAMQWATRGRSKVVSVGLKPRASILLGGNRPELVVWYNAESGRFETGRWPGLGPAPDWYRSTVLDLGPERAAGRTWARFRDDVDYERWAGSDDRPFELAVEGLGRTFPRRLGSPAKRWPGRYPMTPPSLEDLMTLARAAVERGGLGHDDAPDLLSIAISTFDYVGHAYGPGSQESLDMLLRIDASLGALEDALSKRLGGGRVLTLLTSDHGVLPIPEAAAAAGVDARRVSRQGLASVFDGQLREVHPNRLYLESSRRPRESERTLAARREWARRLSAHPDIIEAYVPEDVDRFGEPFRTYYRRGLAQGRTPDILFRLPPYRYVSRVDKDGAGAGTGHGSPYGYDQLVPVVIRGPGVRTGRFSQPVAMTQVAPTIAAILGISPPPAAYAAPLDAAAR